MSDESETDSSNSFFDLQISSDKEDDKANESTVKDPSFIFKPTPYAIDEWLATSTKNSPVSNKYSITSTGNGNVEISRK
jgi:hypothetical protein